jgi:tetratricopeptide (TPR) repeat protein
MTISLLLAGALLTPAAEQTTVYGAEPMGSDVAYAEMMAGQNSRAVDRIKATGLDRAGDPAALINLGTAYARMGDKRVALDCYKSAIMSQDRYDLELSDGRWMDSRAAARLAVAKLAQGQLLALR